jgi:protein disulfide-isomerase
MKALLGLFLGAVMSIQAATALPGYDETADAASELQAALETARSSGRHVIAIFGANWCPECRALSKALGGEAGRLVEKEFVVVKIDIGQFDKNLDIAKAYGNPLEDGIPGAAVLTADNKAIGVLDAGDLSDAVEDGDTNLYELFHDAVHCSSMMCKIRRLFSD